MKITPDVLKDKKKEIIQAECHGLLEFIEPSHNLDAVAGHAQGEADAAQRGRAR